MVFGMFALALSLSLAAPAQQSIPLPELRACAEYEPALGTLITYPTGLPLDTLGVELAEDDTLFVLIDNHANAVDALIGLGRAGVNLANVELILAPTGGFWTRDYGAPQVFYLGGHGYVDPLFYDYAYQAGSGGRVFTSGPGAFLLDDVTPAAVAAYLGVSHIDFPAHLVGGNIDFDGLGRAFCTQVLLDENVAQGIPNAYFRNLMQRYLGVFDLVALPNFELFGIQHIDCALKVLDEETLMIARVPRSHPTYFFHESLAAAAANALTAYGRPYVIHRIQSPVFRGNLGGGETANYCNSLILNSKVLVPLFDMPVADAEALDAYREAMPGYEVLGFPFVSGPYPQQSWASFDSLHCRTHQVFDPEMVMIKHPRIRSASASDPSIEVSALIRDYGGIGLDFANTEVRWRVAGASTWKVASFAHGPHRFEGIASIPAQPAGTTIQYYIRAVTLDQRRETRPPLAPNGFFSFPVR